MSALGTVSLDNMRQLAAHPVVQGINRFGPMVTTVVLVAILAWLFARLVWLLVPGAPDADIEPIATAIPAGADAPAAAANTANVTPIISAHLFGVSAPLAADDEDTVASQDVIDAPETDLPLELKGTLAGNPVEASLAIIKDNGTEKLYGVTGDRRFIRQGVTLHSVHATHVVLNRNGKLESLSLPTASETPAPRAAPRRTSNIRRAPTAQRSMTQVLTQNATQLTQIIQPRPYFVGGQQRGYRLYPGRDRKSFAALGLRPGDIVTEINGTPLNDPAQGAQIIASMNSAQSVTVSLTRNGQQQTLTLDTTQLERASQNAQQNGQQQDDE